MTYFRKISGESDSGDIVNLAATPEGHLEVAIHGPRLPFGSIEVDSLDPVFQTDAVYGINSIEVVSSVGGSGTVTASGNLFSCSTNGTTAGYLASLQSRRRLRYRAGQGIVSRFTGLFTQGVANSTQVIGIGTGEAGLFFGYNGESFGVLHSTGGVREIQTLTVTTASTATNDYVVTLNGTSYTATATNNSSTVKTAYEISQGTYTGWVATQRGSTVVFLSDTVGNKSGAFSLAQTGAGVPATGTFVETLAGAATTDTWTPQASWNGDPLNGSGDSGATLDPTKGNVYAIGVQYLGFGSIDFKVEVASSGNNPEWVTCHTLRFPNTLTGTNISQPSFPFTMAVANTGTAPSNVTCKSASFGGFLAGKKKVTGPRMTYYRDTNNFVGSAASTFYPLFTVRNEKTFACSGTERANQSIVNLLSISASHDDATPVSVYLIRNASLSGTPNFTQFASGKSCTYWDTAATTAGVSTNDQILFSLQLPQAGAGSFIFSDEITLQPGEALTVAARAVTGTATYVSASLNTREDQ